MVRWEREIYSFEQAERSLKNFFLNRTVDLVNSVQRIYLEQIENIRRLDYAPYTIRERAENYSIDFEDNRNCFRAIEKRTNDQLYEAKISRVVDHLYQGNIFGFESIYKTGACEDLEGNVIPIDYVVNLCGRVFIDSEDPSVEINYLPINDDASGFSQLVRGATKEIFLDNIPLWFHKIFHEIDQRLIRKENVFINCHIGRSRSSLLTSIYLANRFHLNFEQAYGFLQRQRPTVWIHNGLESKAKRYIEALSALNFAEDV